MNTVENLRKLADYIEQQVPQDKLDMSGYRKDSEGEEAYFFSKHNCGTSGCALGWAPFVEGLEPEEQDYYTGERDLSWEAYGDRIFPDLGVLRWSLVFGGGLSSDKFEVLKRLRDMANKLENRNAS